MTINSKRKKKQDAHMLHVHENTNSKNAAEVTFDLTHNRLI